MSGVLTMAKQCKLFLKEIKLNAVGVKPILHWTYTITRPVNKVKLRLTQCGRLHCNNTLKPS